MSSITELKSSQSKEMGQERSGGLVGMQRREPKVDRSDPWVPCDGSPTHGMDTKVLGISPPGDQRPHRATAEVPTPPTPCPQTPSSSSPPFSSFSTCAFTQVLCLAALRVHQSCSHLPSPLAEAFPAWALGIPGRSGCCAAARVPR